MVSVVGGLSSVEIIADNVDETTKNHEDCVIIGFRGKGARNRLSPLIKIMKENPFKKRGGDLWLIIVVGTLEILISWVGGWSDQEKYK